MRVDEGPACVGGSGNAPAAHTELGPSPEGMVRARARSAHGQGDVRGVNRLPAGTGKGKPRVARRPCTWFCALQAQDLLLQRHGDPTAQPQAAVVGHLAGMDRSEPAAGQVQLVGRPVKA